MKRLLITLFTVSAVMAAPAAAQTEAEDTLPSEDATIAGCIAEAQSEAVMPDVCLGQVATACEREHPEALAIPGSCWERELAEWDAILNDEMAVVLAEIETAGIAEAADMLRQSHQTWLSQRDLDCTLAVISSPRTYDAIGPGCRAAMTSQRALTIKELRGADWSSP